MCGSVGGRGKATRMRLPLDSVSDQFEPEVANKTD